MIERLSELEQLKEQLEIVEALSRDYLSVFKIHLESRACTVLKIDGYVTGGMDLKVGQTYPYEAMIKKYIRDRVYPGDAERLLKEMTMDNVLFQMADTGEFASGYRAIVGIDIQYFQYKFIMLSGGDRAIVGFKNIDSLVKAAKERDSLIERSEMDGMTGLLNRISGESRTAKALNSGAKGMLCLFDIDKFKSINDTYGHNAGDKAIIGVAKCIKTAFRDEDIVFRLGGDEFVVFAYHVSDERTGRDIVSRIFDRLEQLKIPEIGERRLTLSCGAVVVDGTNAFGFEDTYKRADQAAYASKKIDGNALSFHRI